MKPATRCLLVYPEFRSESFWNYRATCSLVGARYPAAPLGMITVAALLPESWDLRLVDRNVEELTDTDIEWADIVFAGGMISQQAALIDLIELIRERGKPIVVGGPDATSSPHLYYRPRTSRWARPRSPFRDGWPTSRAARSPAARESSTISAPA